MQVLNSWNFTTDDLNRALAIDIENAATQLKVLSDSDKMLLGVLLGKISAADGRICSYEQMFFSWLDNQLSLSRLID